MPGPQFPSVTVATDGSPTALEAVEVAIDLAKRYGARLTVLSVAPLQPLYVAAASEPWVPAQAPTTDLPFYQKLVQTTVDRARAEGVSSVRGVCVEGVAVDEIIGFLEKEPPALFVIGSRGLSRGKRLLLGSVSTAVVQAVKGAVLIVHPGSTKPSS